MRTIENVVSDPFPNELEMYTKNGLKGLVALCGMREHQSGWRVDPVTKQLLDVNKEFGIKVALIHSEISEALEGHRKNKMDDHLPHRKAVEVEFADTIIRIAALAQWMGLDIAGAVMEKLAYNQKRADHKLENRALDNGKKF